MKNIPIINHEKCTLCCKCIDICPKDVLEKNNDKIKIISDNCMLCSHCYNVCQFDAISFNNEILTKPKFKSFSYSEKTYTSNEIDTEELINIIRSRRSIRKFTSDKLSDKTISDLIEFAVTAPSGSNHQEWEFTIINNREKVWELALKIKKFFIKLNKLAKNIIIRYISVIFAGKALIKYYQNNLQNVEIAIKKSDQGIDLLFHGAPSLIIIHSKMIGSTPIEDAQYAAYNITLLAQSLGIGTCFIGYATESINRVKELKQYLKIPAQNRIHAVLALGYSEVEHKKLSLRKPFNTKWL